MKRFTVKPISALNKLRFLLTPEDTSGSHLRVYSKCDNSGWNRLKTLFWVTLSVATALLVGQL